VNYSPLLWISLGSTINKEIDFMQRLWQKGQCSFLTNGRSRFKMSRTESIHEESHLATYAVVAPQQPLVSLEYS